MTGDPSSQDKLAELHARLADEVAALRTGQDWQRWLTAAARLHEYSFQNTLLILSQRPDATTVAGYETWRALGRQVNRGEKGIAVMAPIRRRRPAETFDADGATPAATGQVGQDGRNGRRGPGRQNGQSASVGQTEVAVQGEERRPAVTGFRVTYVWDISQTIGPPLPEPPTPQLLNGQAPDGLWDALADVVAGAGFTLQRGPAGRANGLTDFGERVVRVRADVDDAQAVKTLAHELGHVRLHSPDGVAQLAGDIACLGLIEVEAESVAYLVATAHGLDTGGYTFPYVAGWAADIRGHKPEDVVRITGERVLSAARWILASTETAVARRTALTPSTTVKAEATATAGATETGDSRAEAAARRSGSSTGLSADEEVPRDRLLWVQAEAAAFFAGKVARTWVPPYLTGRRLEAALDAPWQAGCAPRGWTTLVTHLRSLGVDDATLLASGLAMRARTGNLVGTFRDRLMLPLRDDDGQVIGFIGRAHPDAARRTPKYLNSATSAVYAKSEHVYGLWESRELLERGALPVLVEGPLDAIAVTVATDGRAAGIATCGTALTATHLDRIAARVDLVDRGVAVGFDTDPAGHQASNHALTLLTARGFSPVGVTWVGGKDPAQVLARRGPAEVATSVFERALALADLVIDRRLDRWKDHLAWPEGRLEAVRAVAPLLAALPVTVAEGQIERVAGRLDVGQSVVMEAINQSSFREHVSARELHELPRPPMPGPSRASGRGLGGR